MPWLGRGYIERHNAQAHKQQTNRFRRWRPWTWGPLARCWMFGYMPVTVDLDYGPAEYEWCGWQRKGWKRVEEDHE